MSECISCGKPATHLCDFKIGASIAGYRRIGKIGENKFSAFMSMESEFFTCDVPLCDGCRKNHGWIHGSGKDGFHESVYFCPFHASKQDEGLSPITTDEANSIRRDINAYFLRKKWELIRK